jgi:hypothetical protein
MGKAVAPLSGPLGEEMAQVMGSEGSLADVVVSDVLELPWPPRRVLGADVSTARAGVAIRTLHDHLRQSHGIGIGLETGSAIIDLVSDLRHLADALGMDWSYVTEMADENHDAEVGG